MKRRRPTRWGRVLPGQHPPHEGGTLTAVLAVLFVVLLLSVALITRVQGDFQNVNLQTNLEQARANAQSGIADALFQIDQRDGNPGSFCSDPAKASCTVSPPPGAPNVIYTAKWSADEESYTVLSQGEAHGVHYDLQAVVAARPVIGNGLTGSTVTFNGNSDGSFYVTDIHGNNTGAAADVAVATGGTMTCHGPGGGNALYVPYENASLGPKCTPNTPAEQNTTFQPQAPSATCPAPPNPEGQPLTPCMPANPNACNTMLARGSPGSVQGNNSSGWVISGGSAASPVILEPGIYACYGGLTLGTASTDVFEPDYASTTNGGRIQIYVFASTGAAGAAAAVNVSLAGEINPCKTPVTQCTPGTDVVGDPVDLQIYVGGSASTPGTMTLGPTPCTAAAPPACTMANAILWAPDISLTTTGASSALTWTGALVLGNMTANGSPQMTFFYDERVATEFQSTAWQISKYYQLPPSQFTVPNF